MPPIEAETLAAMRARVRPNTKWAAYQNITLDSSLLGHVQFLMFGEGCTHTAHPEQMPDTAFGLGWKYRFIGLVDLDTGTIVKTEHERLHDDG